MITLPGFKVVKESYIIKLIKLFPLHEDSGALAVAFFPNKFLEDCQIFNKERSYKRKCSVRLI